MKNFIGNLKKIDRKHYLIIGIASLLVIVIAIVSSLTKNGRLFLASEDGRLFISEYESLNGELSDGEKQYPKVNITFSNIKYLTIEEVLQMLTPGSGLNGTGAIYIGYAECIYCRNAVQVLVDTAKNSEIEQIYYLDISKYWDIREVNLEGDIILKQEAHSKYKDLLKRLNDDDDYYTTDYILYDKNGKAIDLKERRVASPLVLFVVDGKIVSSNAGTIVSQEDPYTELNHEQIEAISMIYGYGLRDVIEGIEYFELQKKLNNE